MNVHRKFQSIVVGIVLVVSFIFVTSCRTGEPTSEAALTPNPKEISIPEQASTLSPNDSSPWSADGVIENNEYSRHNIYSNYNLFWSSDEQSIYVGMKARTLGWVAIGFEPSERMNNAVTH